MKLLPVNFGLVQVYSIDPFFVLALNIIEVVIIYVVLNLVR